MDPKELGRIGEQLAVDLLKHQGLEIVERNWRYGKIEIDIIAMDGERVVFVEVKTRENSYAGEPWEFVKRGKQRRIISAAHQYLLTLSTEVETRFDIVSVICNSKYQRIEHIPDAFYPML